MSEKDQSVVLTDKGYDDCDRILGKSIFDPRDPWAPYVINSIKAKELFTKDKVWCGVVLCCVVIVWFRSGVEWSGVVWCTVRTHSMTRHGPFNYPALLHLFLYNFRFLVTHAMRRLLVFLSFNRIHALKDVAVTDVTHVIFV